MRLNHVGARTGFEWVRLGIKTFWRQPLAMSGLFFLFMAVVSIVSAVPLVGVALALALLPAATLGLMAASREIAEGRFPMPTVLASAFRAGRERLRAMLQLGALYAAGFLLVMGISALFDGGQFARMYLGAGGVTAETVRSAEFQTAMSVGMLLYLPLALLFWHAPALVHWHGVSPVKSLFFSLMACWHAGLPGGLAGHLPGGLHRGGAAGLHDRPRGHAGGHVPGRAADGGDVLLVLLLHLPRQLLGVSPRLTPPVSAWPR
jgi:hypothetical protein